MAPNTDIRQNQKVRASQTKGDLIQSKSGPRAAGTRLWCFRLSAILIVPALVLIGIEAGLLAFGYGKPTGFVYDRMIEGDVQTLSNPYFTWRFFEPKLAREPVHFSLAKQKPDTHYRIVILGGSAAQGTPEPAYGMARMLQVMLRDRYPGVDFEVVNAAITAINSHVVFPIARDCRKLNPDLFILYLGNNEVVGPYGPGTIFSSFTHSLVGIRTGIALRATKTGQLIDRLYQRVGHAKSDKPGSWQGLEMFSDRRLRFSSREMEIVYHHFEKNLSDIRDLSLSSGIPTIISTVGVNLKDSAPFASIHRNGLSEKDLTRWNLLFQKGIALQRDGNLEVAVETYERAAGIDGEYAELQYRLGQCHYALVRFGLAKAAFSKARDLDALRFRADTRINEIIRRVADGQSNQGIHLVDTAALLEANSDHQIPGDELFYEHVHLRFHGTYLIARKLLHRVEQVIPEWIRSQSSDRDILTEEDCRRQLAYTGWDQLRIGKGLLMQLQRPPFTGRIGNQMQVNALREEIRPLSSLHANRWHQQMVFKQYKYALDHHDSHWHLADGYAGFQLDCLNNGTEAETYWRKALRQCPQSTVLLCRLADALSVQGKHKEAEKKYRQVLRQNPHSISAWLSLGNTFLSQQKLGQAIQHLKAVLEIDPKNVIAHSNLGIAMDLHPEGSPYRAQAIRHLRRAVQLNPELPQARKNIETYYTTRAAVSIKADRLDKAIEILRQAALDMPWAADLRYNLAILHMRGNNETEAADCLVKALEIDSEYHKAKLLLSEIYFRQGRALAIGGNRMEARERLRQSVALNPDSADAHFFLGSIQYQLGDRSASRQHLSEVLRMDPNHQKAHYIATRIFPSMPEHDK